MIDVSKIRYEVIAVTEKKEQINITNAVQGLGWEEGENELSMKMAFKLYNTSYKGKKLSSLINIGCVITVKAYWGSGKGIVATGNIVECERSTSRNAEILDIDARDNLFYMQKSQDNIYFAAGKSTKSALESVFGAWGIKLSEYTGPNVTHAKILYKNSYLSDIILGILDEAKKKGGCKAVVRSTKGKVSVIRSGSNKTIYYFDSTNAIVSRNKISIVDMVTRVKIVSSEKTEGASKVEAVVNGKTDYGVFQRIVNHSGSDNLSEAKTTAQEMIDEDGDPKETCPLEAPDVPPIRKGDIIKVRAGALNGYFLIKGIQHNAESGKMTMQLEKTKAPASEDNGEKKEHSGDYKVGDIVMFNGGEHYVSSDASSPASRNLAPGKAKISRINKGSSHPYSLITEDWNVSHVWGWVDEGTFE